MRGITHLGRAAGQEADVAEEVVEV